MSDEDASDFASTKHKGLPEKAASTVVIAGHRINVPTTPPLQETGVPLVDSGTVSHWFLTKEGRQRPSAGSQRAGDVSILNDYHPLDHVRRLRTPGLDMSNVSELLSATRHKVAEATKRFFSFVLPDGHLLEPRQREALVKAAMMTAAGPMSTAVPVGQAQQAMQQFGGGNPMQAGSGIMATGLDVPGMDTTAAAMPGTPGHAATNVIDQQGGLDPRGLTVDGNNAAGVPKGFKIAEWLREKSADMGSKNAGFDLSAILERLRSGANVVGKAVKPYAGSLAGAGIGMIGGAFAGGEDDEERIDNILLGGAGGSAAGYLGHLGYNHFKGGAKGGAIDRPDPFARRTGLPIIASSTSVKSSAEAINASIVASTSGRRSLIRCWEPQLRPLTSKTAKLGSVGRVHPTNKPGTST